MAAESSSQQQQEFYFVAYPFLELPDFKDAEREFAQYRKFRSQIIDTIRAKRVERKEVLEKIKPLFDEEKEIKERCSEISKRLSEINFNFKNVRVPKDAGENHNICSSEREIDREVRKLELQIKEGRNTGPEEKHMLKQIKDLEKSRGQVLSVEDWNLKRKLKDIWNEKKELRDIDSEIRSLEKDLQLYNNSIDKLYPSLDKLRTRRYQNNELSLQQWAVRDDAIFDFYRDNHNVSELEKRSRLEVEKFMELWNENKEFREEYERRKLKQYSSDDANATDSNISE